jgi:hypothetical protein
MTMTTPVVTSAAHPLASIKAYVALIGSVASGLLGVYAADTEVGKVLTIIVVIATAVATWTVPNAVVDPSLANSVEEGEEGSVTYEDAYDGVEPYDPGAPLHGYEEGSGDPHRY